MQQSAVQQLIAVEQLNVVNELFGVDEVFFRSELTCLAVNHQGTMVATASTKVISISIHS